MYVNTKLAIMPTLPTLCDREKHDWGDLLLKFVFYTISYFGFELFLGSIKHDHKGVKDSDRQQNRHWTRKPLLNQ